MKKRKILKFTHPLLRQEIRPADLNKMSEVVKVVNQLRMRMSTVPCYALAANQIGYDTQVFVYDWHGEKRTIVNPTIVESDDQMWAFNEGCLSIPNFFWIIERPNKVHVKGYDMDGEEIDIEAEELLGRIFQHEIDHFHGKLVIDLLEEDQLKEFEAMWTMSGKVF